MVLPGRRERGGEETVLSISESHETVTEMTVVSSISPGPLSQHTEGGGGGGEIILGANLNFPNVWA